MEYEEPLNPRVQEIDMAWWEERDAVRENYFEALRVLTSTLKQETSEEKARFHETLMELQMACSQALEKANEKREAAMKKIV